MTNVIYGTLDNLFETLEKAEANRPNPEIIQSQEWMDLILQDGRYQGDPTVPGVSARYVDEIPYGFIKVNDFDGLNGYLLVDEYGMETTIDMSLGKDPSDPEHVTGCAIVIVDGLVVPVETVDGFC